MSNTQANPFATKSNNNSSPFGANFWNTSATTDTPFANVFQNRPATNDTNSSPFDSISRNPFSNTRDGFNQQSPFAIHSQNLKHQANSPIFTEQNSTSGQITGPSDQTDTCKYDTNTFKDLCSSTLDASTESSTNVSIERLNHFDDASVLDSVIKGQNVEGLYQKIQAERAIERRWLVDTKKLADPDNRKGLELSIPFYTTCLNKCPSHEIIQRCYQKMIDPFEQNQNGQPDPRRFVKSFHRPAAGMENALPRDVRTPPTLSLTVAYLINDILVQHPLEKVHGFLRDRTRSIRQDFTLQNYHKAEAIHCHEVIARFHIISQHKLCEKQGFETYPEMEQLSKTLTSLSEMYNLGQLAGDINVNEPEFRSYQIIAHSSEHNLERTVAGWSDHVQESSEVKLALQFYQLLQSNSGWGSPEIVMNAPFTFFRMIRSTQTPYLLACLLETRFAEVRRNAFNMISHNYFRTSERITMSVLQELLGYESTERVKEECQAYGFTVVEKDDEGQKKFFFQPEKTRSAEWNDALSKQRFDDHLVEPKAHQMAIADILYGRSSVLPNANITVSRNLPMTADIATLPFTLKVSRNPSEDFSTLLNNTLSSHLEVLVRGITASDNTRIELHNITTRKLNIPCVPQIFEVQSLISIPPIFVPPVEPIETFINSTTEHSEFSQFSENTLGPPVHGLEPTAVDADVGSIASESTVKGDGESDAFDSDNTLENTSLDSPAVFGEQVFDLSSSENLNTSLIGSDNQEPKPSHVSPLEWPSDGLAQSSPAVNANIPTIAPVVPSEPAQHLPELHETFSRDPLPRDIPTNHARDIFEEHTTSSTITSPETIDQYIDLTKPASAEDGDETLAIEVANARKVSDQLENEALHERRRIARRYERRREAEERRLRGKIPLKEQWWPISKTEIPDDEIQNSVDRVFKSMDTGLFFKGPVAHALKTSQNTTWRLLLHNNDWTKKSELWWKHKLLGGETEIEIPLENGNIFKAQLEADESEAKEIGAVVFGCSPDYSYNSHDRYRKDREMLHYIVRRLLEKRPSLGILVIAYRPPIDESPVDPVQFIPDRQTRIQMIRDSMGLHEFGNRIVFKEVVLVETITDVDLNADGHLRSLAEKSASQVVSHKQRTNSPDVRSKIKPHKTNSPLRKRRQHVVVPEEEYEGWRARKTARMKSYGVIIPPLRVTSNFQSSKSASLLGEILQKL
ncbi:SAC3/GANP/Nin1/mts3/eIF-3 p25 family-domain-containing protein [Geopyxis carbonaria]|nr:SAC3/GANP/Nin1/mts3/eIF-3 p25 family-domain-containing protein [Geopyxis carbonaria]